MKRKESTRALMFLLRSNRGAKTGAKKNPYTRWVLYTSIISMALGAAIADDRLTNADRQTRTVQLLQYRADGYKYLVIDLGEMLPSGFEQPGFDDSGFNTGRAAFGGGSGGLGEGVDCPLQVNTNTRWRRNSRLLLRRSVLIPMDASNPRLLMSVDNDIVEVFLNGHSIASGISHNNCPIEDEFRIDLPKHLIRPDEENLLVFHIVDHGQESFFDATVIAEMSNPALRQVQEELLRIIDERSQQIVSIQALSIDECAPPKPDGTTMVRGRFQVAGTGAEGQVAIASKRGQVSVDHMMDGKNMYSTAQSRTRVRIDIVPESVPQRPRTRADEVNSASFPEVLAHPRTVSALTECVAANDHILHPESPCQENIRVAEENCKLVCTQENAAGAAVAEGRSASSSGSPGVLIDAILRESFRDCIRECEKAAKRLRCPLQ